MRRFLLLLPLIPFLWQAQTSFALDALLLVNGLLCLAALLTPLGKRALLVLWLVYFYTLLFHVGTVRSIETDPVWPIVFGMVASVVVILYVMLEMDLREVFRERLSVVAAFLLALFVIVIVGFLIVRYTEGPLSGFTLSVLVNVTALVLALGVWSLVRRQGSAEYGIVLLGVALVSLFGFGRGVVQGVMLSGHMERADTLVANAQYEQALEVLEAAYPLAAEKRFRPALLHLHSQQFRAFAGLERPLEALEAFRQAVQLLPEERHETARLLNGDLIARLAAVKYPESSWRLAVDLEVSDDGSAVFVLDRFGRVFEVREGEFHERFTADLGGRDRIAEAADLELSDNGAGYVVLDSRGGVHVGGTPSDALGRLDLRTRHMSAVDMELTADETALYILDPYGRVTALGEQPLPAEELTRHYWRKGLARDLEIVSNGSLIVMDGQGATHWIGERKVIDTQVGGAVPYWPEEQPVAVDLAVWPDERSWAVLDAQGAVHVVGEPRFEREEIRDFYRAQAHAVDMEVAQEAGDLLLLGALFEVFRVGG